MIEKPWYIKEIEDALANPGGVEPDLVRNAKSAYEDACVEINERLNAIAPYLSRTLRPEAIQLAEETPPDLLDWFALHHRVHKNWTAMTHELWGWEPPPELELTIATQINNAYAREDDLKQLLRAHRRLPLMGGSLEERAHVLRLLVENDPEQDVWAIDLEILEKALNSV